MRVCVVTPARRSDVGGNRVTALRWVRLLRELGHDVTVSTAYRGQDADVLVALHARRSAASVARFRSDRPEGTIVVALTGTDIYRDIGRSDDARRSLDLAHALVVLQPRALNRLPEPWRARARVIFQSAIPSARPRTPSQDRFEVVVLANVRAVKDPLRAAAAARLLPPESRVRIVHAGHALEPELARRVRLETESNPRYEWLGGLSRPRARALLARARLLLLTSHLEGGANVISEAVVAGVPVISSRIDGSIGLLGDEYPGYFEPGDAIGLARLLRRAETDAAFLTELSEACAARRPLFEPARERVAWSGLLQELGARAAGGRDA